MSHVPHVPSWKTSMKCAPTRSLPLNSNSTMLHAIQSISHQKSSSRTGKKLGWWRCSLLGAALGFILWVLFYRIFESNHWAVARQQNLHRNRTCLMISGMSRTAKKDWSLHPHHHPIAFDLQRLAQELARAILPLLYNGLGTKDGTAGARNTCVISVMRRSTNVASTWSLTSALY